MGIKKQIQGVKKLIGFSLSALCALILIIGAIPLIISIGIPLFILAIIMGIILEGVDYFGRVIFRK